jgi:3-oxoacyl-(acyl-carrier-protein) synthase
MSEEMGDGYFDESHIFPRNVDKEMALFTKFAIFASELAVRHSTINLSKHVDPHRAGVAIACSIGSIKDIIDSSKKLDSSVKFYEYV